MQKVRDLVCGMMIDPNTAAGQLTIESRVYYFCSDQCLEAFQAEPARYDEELEKHEPPYTKTGPVVAPKFGAAGSGGLENEPIPERHDRP
jgi:YHS domain-containing protein